MIFHIKTLAGERNWCSAAINLDKSASDADISHAAMQQTH
jgi:hypothetical protein